MASLPQRGPWVDGWPVVGAVSLWGRVIAHAHGYRAEYARPLELFAFPAQSCDRERLAVLEAIAHRYAIAGVSDVGERRRH